jgi:hypothetical protein
VKEPLINRMRSTAALVCSVLLFFCAGVGGCHSKEPGAIVRGKVIYKNAPLDEGTVVFYPSGSGQVAYGNVQKNGTFQLLNAMKTERIEPGKYVAVVVAGTGQIAETKEDPLYSAQPAVPLRFSSATTSPLKYDVVVGENNFDLDLDKL